MCRDFAPDHALAKHIYPKNVRELRLAAYFLADPLLLVPEEFPFWAEGISTSELGAHAALRLFSGSPNAPVLISAWLQPGTAPLLTYTAVMTAASNISSCRGFIGWDWRNLLDTVCSRLSEDPASSGRAIYGESLAALLLRLPAISGYDGNYVREFIQTVCASDPELGDYLR